MLWQVQHDEADYKEQEEKTPPPSEVSWQNIWDSQLKQAQVCAILCELMKISINTCQKKKQKVVNNIKAQKQKIFKYWTQNKLVAPYH